MLTVSKLASLCAGAAVLEDRWVEWVCMRRILLAEMPDPSFRDACLLALRHPVVGLEAAANAIEFGERQTELRCGDGCNAIVDDVIFDLA